MSGSIYAAKEGVFHIEDGHFHRSMELLGWLRSHAGIGVTTETVSKEVSKRLRNRVVQRLDPAVPLQEHSVAYSQCSDRLSDLVACLKVEAITDRRRFSQRLTDVVILYGRLQGQSSRRSSEIGVRVKESISLMPSYLRGVTSNIRRDQFWKESKQLMRLKSKSLSPEDQSVLAEAACLYEVYNRQKPTRLLLASTDLLIAPVLNEDDSIRSDTITRALQDKFKIECDWPHRIARVLRSTYQDA